MELKDKVAVITGGASGIGKATCMQLAEEDVTAIGVVDLNDECTTACKEINKHAGREVAIPFIGDVVNPAFRESVFTELEQRFGPVRLCVPAAGITLDQWGVRIHESAGRHTPVIYKEEDFRRVVDVDLIAPIYWALRTVGSVAADRARKGLKQWVPEEFVQGAIILIGSVSSAGNRGQIAYATAKAGLEGAQATLATEAIYYGVRCAIIHPGYTDTPMVRALGEEMIRTKILPNTQLRRLIRPEEIAGAICFMLKNSAVSGTLWADAGWHPTA